MLPYFPPSSYHFKRRCSRARTHALGHVVATYYNDSLKPGRFTFRGSRDARKGATIDWYSFRGRLYPRTFSRSFVTHRGGHRNVPSIRPTSDALHAPLSLPSFAILRAHVRLGTNTSVFPFHARWKNALYLSSFQPTESVYRKQTRLFSKPEFLLDRIWLFLLLLPPASRERFKMRFSSCFFSRGFVSGRGIYIWWGEGEEDGFLFWKLGVVENRS